MKNKEGFNYKNGWKNNPNGDGVEAKTPFKDLEQKDSILIDIILMNL
jgi:hypothetical protein